MAQDRPVLTGLFRDRDSAERAYQAALDRGYRNDDINVVMSDETRRRHFGSDSGSTTRYTPSTSTAGTTTGSDDTGTQGNRPTELGTKAAKGAGIGAGVGGAIGALAAGVAAVGTSIALPGLGLVIAGPIAAALAGAGAGGAAGGLVGALVGWGIPEERIKEYETGIKEGGILMGVRPRSDDDARHFEEQWRGASGEGVRY
jgi:hypothetical protein